MGNSKKKLNERGKKMLNAKLESYLARPHTLPYEVSAFIYIYIYIYIDGLTPILGPQFICYGRCMDILQWEVP